MIIIDSHLDLGWNAVQWDRDLTRPVAEIRAAERDLTGKGRGVGTVALPELRKGGFALVFATLLARHTGTPVPCLDFRSHGTAYATAQSQRAYYRFLEQQGLVRIIRDRASLEQHMTNWLAPQPKPAPLGFLIAMESADPIQSPGHLQEWWDMGVRCIGPAHYGPGLYAAGTSVEGGLTKRGRELVIEMDRLGMVLDLTHCADEAFWEAAKLYKGPVIASHNNCRALVPGQRQFSDNQLRLIIERDGVVGAAFDNWMLFPGYVKEQTPNTCARIADVVTHIDHVCQLAGNANHAAIGSDLDGGFGREQSPHDLDTIADVQKVATLLRQRGYAEADIEKIMFGNHLRFLRRVLK